MPWASSAFPLKGASQVPVYKSSPFRWGLEPEARREPVLARVTWIPVSRYPWPARTRQPDQATRTEPCSEKYNWRLTQRVPQARARLMKIVLYHFILRGAYLLYKGVPVSVTANVLNWDIVVGKLEHNSYYNSHLWTNNTLTKGMNTFISPNMV